MLVTLAGAGCGTADTMTQEVRDALRDADYVLGAQRLLDALKPDAPCRAATEPQEILRLLKASRAQRCCILFSGDTGFFSGAARLLPLLSETGAEIRTLPGISSVQYFAARLQRCWQDWNLCSAHGRPVDAVWEVMQGKPVCFLLGGTRSAGALCRQLTDAGLGTLPVTLGEALSCPEERIQTGTAEQFADRESAALSVLLAEAAPQMQGRGFSDAEFLRGEIPMTKQEVRAAILASLRPEPGDVCWDVGAGTGSVSIELSHRARQVWAVEKRPEACALLRENRRKFCAFNLRLIEGTAPEVLPSLPKPDCVFVGGSDGRLQEILTAAENANLHAAVCVSAVCLETLHAAMAQLEARGYAVEIVQIAVSRSRMAGGKHMMRAENPVYLLTGRHA